VSTRARFAAAGARSTRYGYWLTEKRCSICRRMPRLPLLLLLSVASCSRTLQAPPPRYAGVHVPPARVSLIHVPLELDLDAFSAAVVAGLDEAPRGSFERQLVGLHSVRIDWAIVPESLALEVGNGTLQTSVKVTYDARVCLRAIPGPCVKVLSCAREPPPQFRLELASAIGVTPQWHLATQTQAFFVPLSTCRITALEFDVGGLVSRLMEPALEELAAAAQTVRARKALVALRRSALVREAHRPGSYFL